MVDVLTSSKPLQAFNTFQASNPDSHFTVLDGWPPCTDENMTWTGLQLNDENIYVESLSLKDVVEIEKALSDFHDAEIDGSEISTSNFILPTLSKRLSKFANEIHNGRGFFVLRGLDIEKYSAEDNALIFLGIASYIGSVRGAQNARGEVFTHIREAKEMDSSQYNRPLKDSRLALTFHTDSFCDMLAMQTRICPAVGGRHVLSSTMNVYNKLVTSRPDIIATLARPDWKFDSRSPHAQAGQRSLLFHHEGRLMMHFAREPLLGLGNDSQFQVQSIVTPEQMEALDAVELIARHDQLTLQLRPGDLTFVNNFNIVHSRETWDENESGTSSRYMVRMWLKNPSLAWSLPPSLQRGNATVFQVDEDDLEWNVLPVPRTSFAIQELFGP